VSSLAVYVYGFKPRGLSSTRPSVREVTRSLRLRLKAPWAILDWTMSVREFTHSQRLRLEAPWAIIDSTEAFVSSLAVYVYGLEPRGLLSTQP
jgi:hypothetical protein